MRILHISSAQTLGGGERHLVDLVQSLTALGHEVHVAVRPRSPVADELTSLPKPNLIELPLRNSLDAQSASRLAQYVRTQKIEIVHAHMARDYPLAAYAARRNRKARLIITRHVLFPLNRLHRFTLSNVGRVIAVSDAVKRRLNAEHLVSPEKIVVIHNGIDVSGFDTAIKEFDRKKFCRDWSLPQESTLVGTVGALTPLKGHEDFLKAAVRIAEGFPAAHFIIAGIDSSPLKATLASIEQLTQELGLNGRVTLIGRMDDIKPLYCALDVFVSASHSESFGLAIGEALAAGTAVVATETEGAQEIVRDGKTGMLVPVRDVEGIARSIGSLLENQEQRVQMGNDARADIRSRFSLDRMVAETEKIYRECLT